MNGKSCFCAPVLCFARSYKDGGQSDTYLNTKGHAAKKELQKQWCELQLARHVAKKEKSTGYQKVDKSKGKYKSLRDLARKEGLQKALAYAQKCSALGGSWLQWDDMWDHWVFFEVEKSWSQIFTKAWSIHLEQTSDSAASSSAPTAPAIASAPTAPAGNGKRGAEDDLQEEEPPKKQAKDLTPQEPQGQGTPEEGAPAKGKAKAKGGAKAKAKAKAGEKKVATPEQKAAKTKASYLYNLSACDNLLSCIVSSGDPKWKWANAEAHLEPIRTAKDKIVQMVQKNKFMQDYMTMPSIDVLKLMSAEDKQTKIGHVCQMLDGLLADLSCETSALVQMKMARDKVNQRSLQD